MALTSVLFDLGGVILDSPLHVIAAYEKECSIPQGFVNRVVADGGGEGAWSRLERGEISVPDFQRAFETECAEAGQAIDAGVLMARIATCRPRPRMLDAVRRLREADFRVGALTNNWTLEDGRQLNSTLDTHFDAFIESAAVGMRKPDPRIYLHACEALGRAPEETVFLDDIGRNLKAARELGMLTIKVEDEGRALHELGVALGIPL